MKNPVTLSLVCVVSILSCKAQASMSDQAVIKACAYVMPSPNPGFQDSVPFTSTGKVSFLKGIYNIRGTVMNLSGTCSIKNANNESTFRFDNFESAKKSFSAENDAILFKSGCYIAVDKARPKDPNHFEPYKMLGEPKLSNGKYIWYGSIAGDKYKCSGISSLDGVSVTFDDPIALARIVNQRNSNQTIGGDSIAIEQAIRNFTGRPYYPVGNHKYYAVNQTRLTNGDDQFQIIMIYAPTIDSKTWGQCSVYFPSYPVKITSTLRDPNRPGYVAAWAVNGSRQLDVYFGMENSSKCGYEMSFSRR